MRVSLISLTGAAAFIAFAGLILAMPHPQWRGLVENTLGLLGLLMLVAAVAGKHRSRAFGVGFLAAALAYITLCFTPAFTMREKLFTHHALELARANCAADVEEESVAFNSPDREPLKIPEIRLASQNTGSRLAAKPTADEASMLSTREADEKYFFVGHLLWAMLFGFVGGVMGAAMTDPGGQQRTEPQSAD